MNSDFATSEQEILLPFQCVYKKLSPEELDTNLSKAKENMAENLLNVARNIKGNKNYTKQQLLDIIDVYEEIV